MSTKLQDAKPTHAVQSTWFDEPVLYVERVLSRVYIAREVIDLLEQDAEARRDWMRQRHRQAQRESSATDYLAELAGRAREEESELEELLRETTLLFMVAVYHAVENTLRSVFRWRLSGLPELTRENLLRQGHDWRALQRLTKTYFNFQLASLKGASEVNVLRLVANAMKHTDGKVSKDLAAATKWKKGEPIPASGALLTRLYRPCMRFIVEFVKAAEKGTRELFGEPPCEGAG